MSGATSCETEKCATNVITMAAATAATPTTTAINTTAINNNNNNNVVKQQQSFESFQQTSILRIATINSTTAKTLAELSSSATASTETTATGASSGSATSTTTTTTTASTISADSKHQSKSASVITGAERVDDQQTHVRLSSSSEHTPRSDGIVVLDTNTMISIDCKEFAQISPYFRAAFFGGFLETESKLLNFDRSKCDEFLHCCALLHQLLNDNSAITNLQWMSLQKAFEMLDIASYLLIDPLLNILSNIIISKVNAISLVLAYHKAEQRHVPLAQKLWSLIVREFDRLLLNNTFLMLSESEVLNLIRDKHLNIKRTDETSMVRKWIMANDYDGNGATKLRNELIGRNDTVGFIEDRPRIPSSILLASGGWSNVGPTMLVEALDVRANQWISSDVKLFELPRAYHAVVSVGDSLYTIGGFNGAEYYRSTRKFNLATKECVEVAPMYDQRCYVGCALMDDDSIIALGGYNNQDRLRSAEILRISSNQWHRIAEMGLRRSDGHCTVVNGVVYAIGGFDGMNCHATVEYYEPEGNRWMMIGNPMNSRRSGVGATSLEGTMVICGGFDGTNRLQSCEFLDPREGKWHRLKSMNRPRSNFGVEILNNQVVVAGGYGGIVGTIGEAESFEFRTNSWSELPTMGLRRSALFLTRVESHDAIEAFVSSRSVGTDRRNGQ